MSGHAWYPLVVASKAREIAKEAASRLRDPQRITDAVTIAAQQTQYPSIMQWSASSVAQGNAGLGILCAYLDTCFPDEGWDRGGHMHLRLATQELSEQPVGAIGLFSGLSGIAFTAWLLSRGETRYQHLLASLDEQIIVQTRALTSQMLGQRHGFGSSQYDVISGLAGIGSYLLCRRTHSAAAEMFTALIHTLIFISEDEAGVPHWYTPPERIMQAYWQGKYPDGLLDCGLAHGIPGPLALLALARLQGVTAEGIDAAIERMACWLAEHTIDDEWGVNWLTAYPAGPDEAAQIPLVPARAAWCYGTPGIARALWLAGEALNRATYRDLAVRAMEAVYRRPVAARNIDAPTFCHGVAGLLQITLRFAHDTGLPLFRDATQALTEQLLMSYEPETLLGFRDIEPDGRRIDQVGLLMGAPGVVLALLAATTDHEPTWDRLFLLG